MTKAPVSLQDLRRRLYVKAKAEPSWRFWGLYVHICKRDTLREACQLAKSNGGAPGIDGVTFEAIEAEGTEGYLDRLREELEQRSYRPQRARKVEIPKEGGKTRQLSIPSIRDRVVQGALKLVLEPIFEADFQPGSFGYRPKKTAHAAIRRVSEAEGQEADGIAVQAQGSVPEASFAASGWVDRGDQSDPARLGKLLCDWTLEPVLFVYPRLGGEEGAAPPGAGLPTSRLRLEAVE